MHVFMHACMYVCIYVRMDMCCVNMRMCVNLYKI